MRKINKVMSFALALSIMATVAAGTVVTGADYDKNDADVINTENSNETFDVVTDASAGIAINKTNFPDEYFREYITKEFDDDEDGYLSQDEINEATDIELGYWYNTDKITDLTGIGYLSSMTTLSLSAGFNCLIENIDLSKNTALKVFRCMACQKLTSPDLSKNTELVEFDCKQCEFGSIDVSHNTKLEKLDCSFNNLKKLDISANKALKWLSCKNYGGDFDEYYLTELDVRNNKELEYLEIQDSYTRGNHIESIDLSQNKKLKDVSLCYLGLKSLDLSQNTELEDLGCPGNGLTSLDVSKNTKLINLQCWSNNLTVLDVSKNTKLETLGCQSNQLTKLNFDSNVALRWIDCGDNELTTLDVSKLKALGELNCDSNDLSSLDVSKNKSLAGLTIAGNKRLSQLDLSCNPKLERLTLGERKQGFWGYDDENYNLGTNIKSIDLSKNPKLMSLTIKCCPIKSVDLSKNTMLTWLNIQYCPITSLDLSKCTQGDRPLNIAVSDNEYPIGLDDTFKLSELPGNFDPVRASDWSGAVYDSSTNTIGNFTSDKITYTYDCGNGKTAEFTLLRKENTIEDNVLTIGTDYQSIFEAVKKIELDLKKKAAYDKYTIVLNGDITENKAITLPEIPITIKANNAVTLTVPSITAKEDLVLYNITAKTTKGVASAVTAKKSLSAIGCTLGKVTVTGDATFELCELGAVAAKKNVTVTDSKLASLNASAKGTTAKLSGITVISGALTTAGNFVVTGSCTVGGKFTPKAGISIDGKFNVG